MTRLLRLLVSVLFAAFLAACGGGGGSDPGTSSGGTGGNGGSGNPGGSTPTPTLTLSIVDAQGVSTTTVGSVAAVYAQAIAKNASGATMSNQLVTFTADDTLVRFVPASGTAMTDASGVAKVQIAPAATTAAGAGVLRAGATLDGKDVSTQMTFQVPQGNSDTQTSKVTNFVMLLDKSTLSNSGTATATLTVIAVDTNNNIVSGAKVDVSTNANTIFTPGGTVTDAAGKFTGTIVNSNDKTDRTVTITTKINNVQKQTTLQIAGSQIALTATPSVLTPGAASTVTARLTDGAGTPISGTQLAFTGDFPTVAGRTVVTDGNGNATVNFSAPSTAGSYLVAAAGSGVTKQMSVQVGSSASIPNAVIPSGVLPSLDALPNVVAPNAAGSTAKQSQLRFLMLDANNVPVPNVRVRFDIVSTGLGSFDSSISTGTATVYTSAAGEAITTFIPGVTGSPTNGVEVRACYSDKAFSSATDCPNSVSVKLTIANQALAVSIGDDNLLAKGTGGTYIKTFVVTVADSAGRAVPDASVDIAVDITHYGKGLFSQTPSFLGVVSDKFSVPDEATAPATFGARVSCINEDKNRNGFVDPGENVNNSKDSFGQDTLEPRKSDIIISYSDPLVKKTNANGVLLIKVEYSQRFATWLYYRVRASTSVSGSQGNAERMFATDFVMGDEVNGSFLTPPYGFQACNSPN